MSQSQLYGIHPLMEAINSGKTIEKVFLSKTFRDKMLSELRNVCKKRDIPVFTVPDEKIKRMAGPKVTQGVVAIISPIDFVEPVSFIQGLFEQGKTPLVVIMDGVTDTRNCGAVMRSALFLGAHLVIIPSRNSAALNADVIKSSAGAIFKIPVAKSSNLFDLIKVLKESGLQVVSASEKGSVNMKEVDLKVPSALVFGSEDEGINPHIIRISHVCAQIPSSTDFDSLNVSVSAGIVLYEAMCQRMK